MSVDILPEKVSGRESPISNALRLPHILAEILGCLQNEFQLNLDHTLFSCSLVSFLWYGEASRLLWQSCGYAYGGRREPVLKDLAKIEPSRRQKYANFIRSISVIRYNDVDDEGYIWDGVWLLELEHLSFPCLEFLHATSSWEEELQFRGSFRQFAQPKLKQLTLWVANDNYFVIAEDFLRGLERTSLGLQEICVSQYDELALDDGWKMSQDRLASFVQNFRSLKIFDWNIDDTLSKALFRVLSNLSQLERIAVHHLHTAWTDVLSELSFPALQNLQARASGACLEALAPHIANVVVLELTEPDYSFDLWDAFVDAQFRHLRTLRLHLRRDSELYSNEIVSIAAESPNLKVLEIRAAGSDPGDRAQALLLAEDFTDATVKQLAEQLPQLTELVIRCFSETFVVTGTSLLTLAEKCPRLQSCHLCAEIDWEELFRRNPEVSWPDMVELFLYDPEYDNANDPNKNPADLARELIRRMPKLRQLRYMDKQLERIDLVQTAAQELLKSPLDGLI